MLCAQELVGDASDGSGLFLKAKLVAKYAGVLLRVSESSSASPALLKGCIGGALLPAGSTAALRYLASQGSRQLYPRPPFKGEALLTAAQIDSWVDYSGSTLAKAVQRWESSGSAKVCRCAELALLSAERPRTRAFPGAMSRDQDGQAGIRGLHAA